MSDGGGGDDDDNDAEMKMLVLSVCVQTSDSITKRMERWNQCNVLSKTR